MKTLSFGTLIKGSWLTMGTDDHGVPFLRILRPGNDMNPLFFKFTCDRPIMNQRPAGIDTVLIALTDLF